MTVKSNEIRTIKIEGVEITPDSKGVVIPDGKVTAIKKNFFFKHYVESGSFTVTEEKATTRATATEKEK